MSKILKLLLILVTFANFSITDATTKFPSVKTTADVMSHLQNLPAGSVIFVDIDDTVITPLSKTAPYNQLIDDIKKIRITIQTTKK